ncbi:MAG: hypothetical protein K2K53_01655 [Oscillospiraceae bacterium]|nr:hypothetical protein [Oscillospiraceae bacterium]
MSLIDELKDLGVNVDEGLDRVMGDNSLYEMMLGMFLSSVQENPVAAADFDGANLDDLIKRVHMLKGVTGNLALTPLFTAYNQSLVLLRAGNAADAKKEFEQMLPVQAKIIDCITRHMGA